MLWMHGGPATIDLWDLKPGAETGGPFRPIPTSVPGVQISEHLPGIAKQMHHLAVIRSISTTEADPERGAYKMRTGYAPNVALQHPAFGAVAGYELGLQRKEFDLPHYISINSPGGGAGFLGPAHAAFAVQTSPVQNLLAPGHLAPFRLENRLALQRLIDEEFIGEDRGIAARDHKEVYQKAARMMGSRRLDAFRLDREDAKTRERYGDSDFGRGCLLARRLVEAGVSSVEVGMSGWEQLYRDAFEVQRTRLQPELDRGMGALVQDLAARGLLAKTLIVWTAGLSRSPRINRAGGRDHWARSWSVVIGGCGIRGGQVIGVTNEDGSEIAERPVDVPDLIATIYGALGVPLDRHYTAPRGRPYWVVDPDAGAHPIAELLSQENSPAAAN